MTYKNVALGIAFAAVIGIAAWMTISYRGQSASMTQTTALPDAYMEDVVAVIMNKQGKINMKIVTPKIVHYPEHDLAQFTLPHLTIYRKSPQPWYVTSVHAKTVNGTDQIDFWEDVEIHHSADSNNPATLIKTTSLAVHPNSQTAETNDPIALIQPNLVVNGVGMYADMSTGYVKLLTEARGVYVPG